MANVKKFYAVKKGRKPGIYKTWEECQAQVEGFAKAEYKSFARLEDARDYLKGKQAETYIQPALLEVEAPAPPEDEPDPGRKQVVMYTDGGAIGNPGPGGFGTLLIYEGQRREFSGGFRRTTNNRMELMAVITGLEALKEPVAVKVHSDSSYIVNAMRQGMARRWQQQNWRRKDGPVPNADLWQRLLEAAAPHQLSFEWVPGHSGIPENERCDRLATAAAAQPGLPADEGYEASQNRGG